jgi:hypothetical protein
MHPARRRRHESAQRGKKITVKVTANRTGHTSGPATSKPTSTLAR